jgi:hypothetical protein
VPGTVVVKQSSQDSAVPEFVDANDFLVMLALAKYLEE